MRNNRNSVGSNAPFILIIALFIIVFVVVSYFLVSGSAFGNYYVDDLSSQNSGYGSENTINPSTTNQSSSNKEVYNIRDNVFTYDEAKAVCAAHSARLATLDEMIGAYKKGANWCSYGWTEGQMALYPTQKEYWAKLQMDNRQRDQCGQPGLNGGYFENKDFKFGANCYGQKPSPKPNEVEKDSVVQGLHNPYEQKISEYREGLNTFRISPHNPDSWKSN
jgi:hypothetical protein